jgi:ribosome-binding ATPase YchF (GTP1/OBG family)
VKIGLFCSTPMVALSRVIGQKRAMQMLLTGIPIDARTAADWGLVNEVVPAEQLAARTREIAAQIAAGYGHRQALVDAMSARIEMELGELEPDEARVFMDELGLAESALDRVIALSYRLLGLVSFLTAGPDEVRAWPIPDGSTAVDAAGAIHSDLARGFIRAETVAYEDLLTLGSMAEARKAGKLRSEGKTYHVRDGDVIEVLFSR